ncbi:hypothetical protein HDU96_001467 [Phlyctochytrium bullatum]|nr:hypothetical protein HDU96_001467 [Phlyctochytrium bullatum]
MVLQTTVSHRWLKTYRGLRLGAKILGGTEGRGHRMIALHGWLDNAGTWDLLLPSVLGRHPDEYHVVCLDLAGHGFSSHRGKDSAYIFQFYMEDVMALGWETCQIMGHSLGGAPAALLAGTYPDPFTTLISIEAMGPNGIPYEDVDDLANHLTFWHEQHRKGVKKGQNKTIYPTLHDAVSARMYGAHKLTAEATWPLVFGAIVPMRLPTNDPATETGSWLPQLRVEELPDDAVKAPLKAVQAGCHGAKYLPTTLPLSYLGPQPQPPAAAPPPTSIPDDGGWIWSSDARFVEPSVHWYKEESMRGFLRRIARPTLVVWAEEGLKFLFNGEVRPTYFQKGLLEVVELPGGHHMHLEPVTMGPCAVAMLAFLMGKAVRRAGGVGATGGAGVQDAAVDEAHAVRFQLKSWERITPVNDHPQMTAPSDEAILAAIQGMALKEEDRHIEGARAYNADITDHESHSHSHTTADGPAYDDSDRRSLDWDEKEQLERQQRRERSQQIPDPKTARMVRDQQTRQNLGLGGAMTGPKGVLADYKFHQRQERARAVAKERAEAEKLSAKGMSSGWMQREIAREERERWGGKDAPADDDELGEDEEEALFRMLDGEDDPYLQEYRMKRMQELAQRASRRRFGAFSEIEVDQFLAAIEGPDVSPDTTVVVHLFQPAHDGCRLVNAFLSVLAAKYPFTRFVRIVSTKADRNFDDVALPALLVYRGGELAVTLLRVVDEVAEASGAGRRTGRCDLEEFEAYLVRKRVLDPEEADDEAGGTVGSATSKLAIRAAINSLAAE